MQVRNSADTLPSGFEMSLRALVQLAGCFSERGLNTIPFKGSWTGGQVTDHLVKSNRSIAQALSLEGKGIQRSADERKDELAGIFLDFTTKLKAPDFILPDEEPFNKSTLLAALKTSVDQLREAAAGNILHEAIEHPAFGEITKLELLYFVVYHTQRHFRQLQHIYEIVENKQYKVLSFLFASPALLFL